MELEVSAKKHRIRLMGLHVYWFKYLEKLPLGEGYVWKRNIALIDTINLSSTVHIISCSLDAVMWSGREYTVLKSNL